MPEKKKPASKNIASQLNGVIGRVASKVNQITGDAKGTIIKQIDTALERKKKQIEDQLEKNKEEQKTKRKQSDTLLDDTIYRDILNPNPPKGVFGEKRTEMAYKASQESEKAAWTKESKLRDEMKDLNKAIEGWNRFKQGASSSASSKKKK